MLHARLSQSVHCLEHFKELLAYFSPFFLAILGHRAYRPQKSVNCSLDFTMIKDFWEPLNDCKPKEEIELSIRSIGNMAQICQKNLEK